MNTKLGNEVITDFKGVEKEHPLLKWGITASAVFLVLFVLALFLISNKDLIFSRMEDLFSRSKAAPISNVENPDPSRTTEASPPGAGGSDRE